MSIALLVIGFVILIVGLPWLGAALAMTCWGLSRCFSALTHTARLARPPAL
jgi:hypothetical protein